MLWHPLPVEPSHGLLTEVQPPVIGIRACPELEADFEMHGAIGVVGFLLPLTFGVVVMVCHGFQMPCVFVFFASRIIQTARECPRVGLVGVGDKVRDRQEAERGSQVVGCPGTDTEPVRPMGSIWGIDNEARQTGEGFMPRFRHNKRIGYAKHLLPLRLGKTEVSAPHPSQAGGRMVDNALEQGAILAAGRVGWASIAYTAIPLRSI